LKLIKSLNSAKLSDAHHFGSEFIYEQKKLNF
jgi:hypothetical protein